MSIPIFLFFDNPEPTCSPIGCMAISAPKLNKLIPKIKNIVAIIKTIYLYLTFIKSSALN